MKYICGQFCLIFLLFGCQDRQTQDTPDIKNGLNPSLSTELNNKAKELLHSNPDSALIFLDSALKFDSTDYILYFNKGHVFISKGEYLKTIDIYKLMLTKKPDFAQGITFLGMLYEKTGKSDSAKLEYSKAIHIYDARLKNSDSIQNEDKINRIFALYLLDSANAKPQLDNLTREIPENGFLKMLEKSSRFQIINGFLPN